MKRSDRPHLPACADTLVPAKTWMWPSVDRRRRSSIAWATTSPPPEDDHRRTVMSWERPKQTRPSCSSGIPRSPSMCVWDCSRRPGDQAAVVSVVVATSSSRNDVKTPRSGRRDPRRTTWGRAAIVAVRVDTTPDITPYERIIYTYDMCSTASTRRPHQRRSVSNRRRDGDGPVTD